MNTRPALRTVSALLAAGWLAAGTTAQNTDEKPLPTAAAILNRHVEVTGGKKAHLALTTRKMTGKLLIDMFGHKFEAKVEKQAKAPNLSYMVIDSSTISQVIVSNGEHAWEWSRGHGGSGSTRLLDGEMRARRLDAAVFDADVHWRTLFKKAKTKGVVELAGKPAYRVDVTSKHGKRSSRFYDKASGRLVGYKQDIEMHGGKGSMEVSIGAYKQFDGVWLPTRVRAVLTSPKYGKGTQTWVYAKIEHGCKISPKLFAMPPEVREQVEAKARHGDHGHGR